MVPEWRVDAHIVAPASSTETSAAAAPRSIRISTQVVAMHEKTLGNFLGLTGRARYECPRCGRTAPYDVERMTGRGSFPCPSCRIGMDNPPLLQRVEVGRNA